MGNTCKPMAVSFQCMRKSTTIKKKKLKKNHKFTVETNPQKTHVKSKLKWVYHACQEIPSSSE